MKRSGISNEFLQTFVIPLSQISSKRRDPLMTVPIVLHVPFLLQETMKIMGLPNWLHWMAWFVKCFLYMLIAAILVVLVLKVKWLNKDYTIFTYTDGTVLMFFFILFICATITFCFAVSVFFKKGSYLYIFMYML